MLIWPWPDPRSRSRSLTFSISANCTFLRLSPPAFWRGAQNWWLITTVWVLFLYFLSCPRISITRLWWIKMNIYKLKMYINSNEKCIDLPLRWHKSVGEAAVALPVRSNTLTWIMQTNHDAIDGQTFATAQCRCVLLQRRLTLDDATPYL